MEKTAQGMLKMEARHGVLSSIIYPGTITRCSTESDGHAIFTATTALLNGQGHHSMNVEQQEVNSCLLQASPPHDWVDR